MAINLKAVAYLNTGPYTKSLKALAAKNAELVASTDKLHTRQSRDLKKNAQQERNIANARATMAQKQEQAFRSTASSIKNATWEQKNFAKAQEESARITDRILRGYREMSKVDARHNEAKMRSVEARLSKMRNTAGADGTNLYGEPGLQGPAATAYGKKAEAARVAQGKTLRAVNDANATALAREEAAAVKAAAAQRKLADAHKAAGAAATYSAGSLASQRYMLADMSRSALTGAAALAALPVAAIAVSASWEKAYSSVIRTSDPEFANAPKRVDALRNSMVSMVQAMPISFSEVADIATLGNQMGIAAGQINGFTQAVAMFSATSGVSVDVTATAFGRLTSIMGKQSIPFMEMADSILKVGVNSVATEDEIINITTQISAIAGGAGFSTKEMIAFSGALASVRVPPELARGVVTRVFGQMDKAVAGGGAELANFARISGMTSKEFATQWGTGQSAKVLNSFMQGLHKLGPAARGELEAVGITSVRDIPVTLRLANAADSDGNEGGLFTQTLRDANNAAGETQRQYTIMADTVASKLQVLGNNLLAFFDAAGSSSLGPFGDMLDGLTKGIRNFTRDLEKPAALIGDIFGTTNGELLGLGMNLALAGSGILALGSAVLKVRSIFKGIAQMSLMGGVMGNIGDMIPMFSRGEKSVANFGRAIKVSGTASTGLFTSLTGLSPMFGVVGLGIAGALTALTMWNNAAKEASTTGSDIAEWFASVDTTSATMVEDVLQGIKVPDLSKFYKWENTSNPFAEGVEQFRGSIDQIAEIRDANAYSMFGKEFTFGIGRWVDMATQGMWDDEKGLQQFDDSLQALVDGGNATKAMQIIQNLGASGKQLQSFMNEDVGAQTKDFLQNAFDLAGLDMNATTLDKLAKGQLPELTDAMYGVVGSGQMMGEVFEGDEEAMGKFVATLDEGAAAFIDFGSAIEKATKVDSEGKLESFSLGDFTKELSSQVKAQEDWMADMSTITQHGSAGVVEALGELGPAGQHAAAALAEGLRNGDQDAIDALAQLEASVAAKVPDIGSALGTALANKSWATQVLGDADLAGMLAKRFDDSEMSELYEASRGVGEKASSEILNALVRGEITYDQALDAFFKARPPIELDAKFKDGALEAVDAKLKGQKVDIDAEINAETTVGDLRSIIDDPALNEMDIDANLTLTEAYASSAEFQAWAEAKEISMYLGASDLPARFTTDTLVAYANGQVAKVQIDAVPEQAGVALYDFVKRTDGTTAFVPLDADGNLAEGKLSYIVDKAGNTVGTVKVDANDADAVAVASRWDGKVVATAFIDVVTRNFDVYLGEAKQGRHYSAGPGGSGGLTQADGGLVSYYADGGVRENHLAQIAPAGAMRVWAEPETGGEAYIPLAQSKRMRSLAILDNVADRFGYDLQPRNFTKFADGGTYAAQSYDRQVRRATSTSSQAKMNIGEINIGNNQGTDQMRELTRTLNRAARGL